MDFPTPLEFLKSSTTRDGGQIKAIIISRIIMNIFLLLKGRLGRGQDMTFERKTNLEDQQDMKTTAPKSFFTIMNKRLLCLIIERFIVYHGDM